MITSTFVITGLLGLVGFVYGWVHLKQTGKVMGMVYMLLGLFLLYVAGKAWSDFRKFEPVSVHVRA